MGGGQLGGIGLTGYGLTGFGLTGFGLTGFGLMGLGSSLGGFVVVCGGLIGLVAPVFVQHTPKA